jgi:hypothetical protein
LIGIPIPQPAERFETRGFPPPPRDGFGLYWVIVGVILFS